MSEEFGNLWRAASGDGWDGWEGRRRGTPKGSERGFPRGRLPSSPVGLTASLVVCDVMSSDVCCDVRLTPGRGGGGRASGGVGPEVGDTGARATGASPRALRNHAQLV